MERSEFQPIGEILNQFLRLNQLENKVFADQIAEVWQKTLGDDITLATQNISLNDGVLYIELQSSSLKQNLMMQRSFILNALNRRLGKKVISQVVFR